MLGNPHICGGTLISYDPALVLTAAHCVDASVHPTNYTKDNNPYFALYNDINREDQKSVAIVDWNIHPLYNVSGNINPRYDAAIIKLGSPLKKSPRIRRVPFWSPSMSLSLPTEAELIGFGYQDTKGHLAQTLQKVKLEIIKINTNSTDYIETRTYQEDQIACHGDSGGPLIVNQTIKDPSTNDSVIIPFVLGDLTRIFGARDNDPKELSCPVPIEIKHDNGNPVIESFTNIASLLNWVSNITGISTANLTDPFYSPPHPICTNCESRTNQNGGLKTENRNQSGNFYDNIDDDDELDDSDDNDTSNPKWNIGVVADENGLLDTDDHFWIGSMMKEIFIQSEPEASSAASINNYRYSHFIIVLFIYIFTSWHI